MYIWPSCRVHRKEHAVLSHRRSSCLAAQLVLIVSPRNRAIALTTSRGRVVSGSGSLKKGRSASTPRCAVCTGRCFGVCIRNMNFCHKGFRGSVCRGSQCVSSRQRSHLHPSWPAPPPCQPLSSSQRCQPSSQRPQRQHRVRGSSPSCSSARALSTPTASRARPSSCRRVPRRKRS